MVEKVFRFFYWGRSRNTTVKKYSVTSKSPPFEIKSTEVIAYYLHKIYHVELNLYATYARCKVILFRLYDGSAVSQEKSVKNLELFFFTHAQRHSFNPDLTANLQEREQTQIKSLCWRLWQYTPMPECFAPQAHAFIHNTSLCTVHRPECRQKPLHWTSARTLYV